MGQQQLILLILGVIVVGIAISVGILLFGGQSAEANRDGVTSSLVNIAADAHQYKMRPKVLGGGRPSYLGYQIPPKLRTDDNGTYEIQGAATITEVTFLGHSSINNAWTATCKVDSNGFTMVDYSGWN
jgi:hypothetical protein